MNQSQLDSMLKWGIIFSLFWLAGVGSLVAVVLGLKARTAIAASNGMLVGSGRVRWCLIVGGLGLALWVPIVVIGMLNQL